MAAVNANCEEGHVDDVFPKGTFIPERSATRPGRPMWGALFGGLPFQHAHEPENNRWNWLVRDAKSTATHLARENNLAPGEENLLTEALWQGYTTNKAGGGYFWMLPRLPFLARHLARVDEPDAGGLRPLMRAVQWGDSEVVHVLLTRVPADVNIAALCDRKQVGVKGRYRIGQYSFGEDTDDEEHPRDVANFVESANTRCVEWLDANRAVLEKGAWYGETYAPAARASVASVFDTMGVPAPLSTFVLEFMFEPCVLDGSFGRRFRQALAHMDYHASTKWKTPQNPTYEPPGGPEPDVGPGPDMKPPRQIVGAQWRRYREEHSNTTFH